MRPFAFLAITVIVGALVLAGCTKIESSQDGQGKGIRLGFVEKEKIPPATPGEEVVELKPGQEPVNASPPLPEETKPIAKQETPPPIPEPPLATGEDVRNDTQLNETLLHDESTNMTNTTTNMTNTTGQEPATGYNTTSEDQEHRETDLGFEIRIDANRYYRDGAVRCHNNSVPQCVHIHIGPQGCGADCHFDPEVIMIPVGTTIEWGNHDTAMHQIIAQDESFLSNPLEPIVATNGTYPNYAASHLSFAFNTPGEYRYHGEQGSSLTGVVIVVTSLS